MRPTRVYQAEKPNPRPILVEAPSQPHMFSQSDAAAIQQSDRVSGTEHGRNGWRTLINYISGGQGGSGGGGGLRGGAGGIGEGPTLQYDMKAERIVVKNFTSPEAPPSGNFRRIPLGDIDLRSDIQVNAETGAVWRRCERKSVRRMYSARVVGHTEPMTVALYEGEEEWKRDLSRYSCLRHPHILQIYASASSSGIHAVIFHDELVLFSHFLDLFRYSPVLTAYIMVCMFADWKSAYNYSTSILPVYYMSQICWIRHSTGRLCVDFNTLEHDSDNPYNRLPWPSEQLPTLKSILNLHDPPQESSVTASLGYHEWHLLCHFYLGLYGGSFILVRAEVKLGSIICWPLGGKFKDALEIAFATDACITQWSGWYGGEGVSGVCRGDSCATRYNSVDVFNRTLHLTKSIKTTAAPWLAQANYILSQLKIVSNHEDYKYIEEVWFQLDIGRPTRKPPDGYLFVCSPKDFETGPMSYRWPHRPAYWSLDSSGDNPLSHEDASSLGFPSIRLLTHVDVLSWDETVYVGLHKFDECKGFNPESQDVAKELGYPLYEISDGKWIERFLASMEWDLAMDREDGSDDSPWDAECCMTLDDYMREMEPDSDSDSDSDPDPDPVSLIEELTGEDV
ncbi:hypothetical protein MSAN_00313500 [Mycena sanguinolenta]|uniref:Protein kinase domain-containing protein n=1 Tax=Mycena sanguinolenta TaxID=230812 RepID=A0A8H6Z8K6_9AGAR|nr:hypothetical protein MSAN_00313500 [Mycena sanguinolenta]